MLRAIYLPVINPHAFTRDREAFQFVARFGWIFIVVRWLYYSIVFQWRDYHGRWAPFVALPFGLSIDEYAAGQRLLALPFGLVLMFTLAMALVLYLRMVNRSVPAFFALNVLGATFFLPAVALQPIDQLLITVLGWKLVPVTIIHTAALLWESWAALEIIGCREALTSANKITGIAILTAAWILLTGPVWR